MEHAGYAKLIPTAKSIFLEWDQAKIASNFPFVKRDELYYYLSFIYRPFMLSRLDGRLYTIIDGHDVESENPFDYLIIMDMLCSEMPFRLSGEWCPVSHFSKFTSIGEKGEQDVFAVYAGRFTGNAADLSAACKRLGGVEYTINKSADVSYKIDLFDFFPVILQFWDKDEEFPAEIRMLWDTNTMDYLLFETTFFAASCLLKRIYELTF